MGAGRTRRALAGRSVALAVGCVVLGGCGGGAKPLSRTAYDARMASLGARIQSEIDELAAVTTPHAGVLALERTRSELEAADRELAAISAPGAIRVEQARLVAAVAAFARELDPVIERLAAGDLGALAGVYSLAALAEIARLSKAIDAAGYSISASS